MHFCHTNCGIVAFSDVGVPWHRADTSQSLICVATALQPFLAINTGNNHWVSNAPCSQPMFSLWMRCYLHPSRWHFILNPQWCNISPARKGCAYPHSPQQHFSTSFPAASTALALWAASPGQAALQSGLCLLESLGQHIEGLNSQQGLCWGSSWSQRSLWMRGRGVGPLISGAARGQVSLSTHFMASPYSWKLHFVQTHGVTAMCCTKDGVRDTGD